MKKSVSKVLKIFPEIDRPLSIVRGAFSFSPKDSNIGKLMPKGQQDVVDKPLVSGDTHKDEFEKRYSGLRVYRILLSLFILYIGMFLINADGLLAVVTTSVILAYVVVSYMSASYRAWLARYVYQNWERRESISKPPATLFLSSIAGDFSSLLPWLSIKDKVDIDV